jgi:hypothetical protein
MSALDLRVSVGHPLVRGALSLYPLFGDGPTAPDYVPGPVAADAVHVGELPDGPDVPALSVRNAGSRPVLLLEGENLLGGWQNRTLNVSVLLAAGTTTSVPVSCVERGRWGGRADHARGATTMAPTRLRERKQRAVAAGVLAGGVDRRADQGDVWAAVQEYSIRLDVQAPTEAMADVQAAREDDVTAMVDGSSPLAKQRGVAVAIGGQVVSVDLFDRASTMAAYWASLVRGYALDAVGAPAADPPGRRAVVSVFDALRSARTKRVRAVGLGDEIHASSSSVTAGALVWDDVCVHLAVHCAA